MLAQNILSGEVFPLKPGDKVDAAKIFFEDWGVAQLPVVEDNKVLGYIDHKSITEEAEQETIQGFLKPYPFDLPKSDSHLFEVLRLLTETGFSSVPVINAAGEFIGIVTPGGITGLYKLSPLMQPGAIITLEMNSRDYSLSELSRIIEYNDCKIVHLFLNKAGADSNMLIVSLKLNTSDVRNILTALERYNYRIRSVHESDSFDTDMNDRFDWLIKFINT